MQTTYDEFIHLIMQLNHTDKLHVAQWLINAIALEEDINNAEFNNTKRQTGLCGIWQDQRLAENIVQEIISNRNQS